MRMAARVFAVLLFLPAVALLAIVVTGPPSLSGLAYSVGALALVIAGLRKTRRSPHLASLGLLLLVGTAALRIATASHGKNVQMSTPGGASSRWVDRLLDEEDLSVNAARALRWTGFVRDPDVPDLAPVMQRAYDRMRGAEGATPSPVVATCAGLEAPGQDDVIEVGDVEHSAGVVVFLHGFAGSFTLPCWVVSQAAADAGFATVCPATRWVGDWWSPAGERALRETIGSLQRRGAHRIVLAGLSNGGVGASRLAPHLRGILDSLILISGAASDASSPGVPALAIQGERDAQIPAWLVRAYAERVGGRYLSLDAGHFALLAREEEAHAAITTFLRGRLGAHAGMAATP
jgi:hypothetical protein